LPSIQANFLKKPLVVKSQDQEKQLESGLDFLIPIPAIEAEKKKTEKSMMSSFILVVSHPRRPRQIIKAEKGHTHRMSCWRGWVKY
jgi:hypothetical protein